ncbi:HAMP domain-containing histidine kinase [Ruminiclostridium herbifermentans]|uniref:histidine kinase n=1 Tax=Ruminiclostridium herbifermentans TaxID=2488810 RepID=A0A4U7JHY8_9FIRM|nr:HAMP domain-containing sensor histidine kinase [Ruminiclostridium herbifermentans]QNU67564.1 HAMP domain-containing histidine kinase [Ruminiclostridium herbifermentans]
MFATFILLWVISILLIYANPKTTWAWWGSACFFLNGFGGVAVIFSDNIIPYVAKLNCIKLWKICCIIQCIADILHHYFATYAFMCFALYFTKFLGIKISTATKHFILFLLAMPSIGTFIIYPQFEPSYKLLSAWVVPYTIVANAILIISVIKEKECSERYHKVLVCICATPTTLILMWTSYLSVAMGIDRAWELNIYIILAQFIIFVTIAFKHGILGIRLRVERSNLDEAIDTTMSGMSIISHAIKNESATINLCVDTIRATANLDANTERKLNIIKNSSRNLSDFAQRINKFRIYDMDLEPHDLKSLVDKTITQVSPMLFNKDIKIINKCKENITVTVDSVHASEVLKNLIINSIEAIETNGIIRIESEYVNNKVCLSVIDNGIGIDPENIKKVLTPFYSTKKSNNNFGLGLSYCYRVMKCHKGNLKISSKVNQGTKMSLFFPAKRVFSLNSISVKAESNS